MLPKKDKSPQEVFKDHWRAMHEKEWLFPQIFPYTDPNGREVDGPATSEDYIEAFTRKQKMFLIRSPAAYKTQLLDKYKDKIVFSSHQVVGGAISPYTIIQLDGAKSHLIADWIWDGQEQEFFCMATLLITDQRDYGRFLRDHKELEMPVQESRMGFNVRGDDSE